ncbi:hypothetical protein D3C73_1321220 [compost metagenome]
MAGAQGCWKLLYAILLCIKHTQQREAVEYIGQACQPVVLHVQLPEAVQPADGFRQQRQLVIHDTQFNQLRKPADFFRQRGEPVVAQIEVF